MCARSHANVLTGFPNMADTTETQEPVKKKSPMPMIGIALAGMLGVTVATMVVAPKVVASRAAAAVEAATSDRGAARETSAEDEAHEDGGGGGHGGGGAPSGDFVELGNLLVNPAGSQGLRFLMASVTFEVLGESKDAVGRLRAREAQLRDMVIGVLEQYDLERLSSPGARDSVKLELAAAVDSVFRIPVGVFMPQFVIN